MPGGWRLGQIQAEQPSTTYAEFKKEILNEIARCLNMPYNVAAGNSSGYNYASGRLDHQTYYKSIRVDQDQSAWRSSTACSGPGSTRRSWSAASAALDADGRLPRPDPPVVLGRAGARRSGQGGQRPGDAAGELHDHLAYEYAQQGRDWESELRQRAKETPLMEQLGLSPLAQRRKGTDQSIGQTSNARRSGGGL